MKISIPESKTVYMARCISDMTEGRGHMINHTCFEKRQDADAFIDQQAGVMGRRKNWSDSPHGDWDVMPIEVFNSVISAEEARTAKFREKTLAKLSKKEKEVLGLV